MRDGASVAEKVVPEVVAKILAGRGMASGDIEDFVFPDYDKHLHDPFLMTDMRQAVGRIMQARERVERVVVYGDYDIDGITASAVLLEMFESLGVAAVSYIPDRFEEGYGLNQAALEKLKSDGAALVVSVDCGITSVAEAQWAREHGLDLIITDHHAVPDELPDSLAVINPKRPGDKYPFKELAGVGVAFKLAQALQAETGVPARGQEKWLLDLVGLGTICDVVPLVGENRVLASFGLRVLRATRRRGLVALAEVAGIRLQAASAYHAGYMFGPRMNAAGRLDHAGRSLELLTTGSGERGREIALELEELNRQRRERQDAIFKAVDGLSAKRQADSVLVTADPEWSHGVVGIVASKIAEKWHKPALVAQVLGDKVKGSARSVPGFNMVEALRANADLLERFGGHYFAAGYTLDVSNLDELRRRLNAQRASEGETAPAQEVAYDLELADLEEVSWATMGALELLEPHGNSNPRPELKIKGLNVAKVVSMGKTKEHIRIELTDGGARHLTAVGFGMYARLNGVGVGDTVSVSGILNKNEYQGSSMLQLVMSNLWYE